MYRCWPGHTDSPPRPPVESFWEIRNERFLDKICSQKACDFLEKLITFCDFKQSSIFKRQFYAFKPKNLLVLFSFNYFQEEIMLIYIYIYILNCKFTATDLRIIYHFLHCRRLGMMMQMLVYLVLIQTVKQGEKTLYSFAH